MVILVFPCLVNKIVLNKYVTITLESTLLENPRKIKAALVRFLICSVNEALPLMPLKGAKPMMPKNLETRKI